MNQSNTSLAITLEILRAIAEHTRLRILLLCSHGELSVGDLVDILEQSQPRVSRHLRLMHEAGVLERHQEGQSVWFRAVRNGPVSGFIREAVDQIDPSDPVHSADLTRLARITKTWEVQARSYFRKYSDQWDQLRRDLIDADTIDTMLREKLEHINPGNLLDIGTGTGHVLRVLSNLIDEGVGIDTSREMLLAARAAIHNEKLPHCQVRQADMRELPFESGSFDSVSVHLALHYADDPQDVIKECGRVLRPGGHLMLVDFLPHDRHDLMQFQGHRWLGFADEDVRGWLSENAYVDIETSIVSGGDPPVAFWFARSIPEPVRKGH